MTDKITEEEYQKACKIIDQYHKERQEEADEWNEDDERDYDRDDEEDREMEEYEFALNCSCGAWQLHNGRAIHVADCVCGAE